LVGANKVLGIRAFLGHDQAPPAHAFRKKFADN